MSKFLGEEINYTMMKLLSITIPSTISVVAVAQPILFTNSNAPKQALSPEAPQNAAVSGLASGSSSVQGHQQIHNAAISDSTKQSSGASVFSYRPDPEVIAIQDYHS